MLGSPRVGIVLLEARNTDRIERTTS